MKKDDQIPNDVFKEIQMVRHFLFMKIKSHGRVEVVYYDASTEEEIFKGRCHRSIFTVLEKKRGFSKVDFFTKNGLPAFSFKRKFFRKNLNLTLSNKLPIGRLTPKNLLGLKNNEVCFFKKRGEVLEFYNYQKATIGMRRIKVPKKRFRPSSGLFPQRDYDGEVVFYEDALLPEVKLALLGVIFL